MGLGMVVSQDLAHRGHHKKCINAKLDYTADRTCGYFWDSSPVVQASLEH